MSFTEEKLTTESEARFNHLVRDITQAGFMAKSEARRRLEEIVQLELAAQKQLIKDELAKQAKMLPISSVLTLNPFSEEDIQVGIKNYKLALEDAINLIDKI